MNSRFGRHGGNSFGRGCGGCGSEQGGGGRGQGGRGRGHGSGSGGRFIPRGGRMGGGGGYFGNRNHGSDDLYIPGDMLESLSPFQRLLMLTG